MWQEGHTLHETSEEAEKETVQMLNVYKDFFENYLAIPVVVGKKTEKEKFAGAEYTLTVEALMYNGISLQSGTSHYFGQKFTKPFDIKFSNKNNELEYAYQTSWGTTTRMIGGLIMVHSDDYGLVLPPKIAPRQVVIVPIKNDEMVNSKATEILNILLQNNISAYIDDTDKSAGYKFAEAEVNGIPVRVEIGPRDLENNMITLVRRDTREKMNISLNENILDVINELMNDIQNSLYNKALERNKKHTFSCTTLDEVREIYKTTNGFIKAMWCGSEACELKFKEINGIKSRCIPFEQEKISEKCICCGKEAKHMVVWGKQY